MVAGASRPLRQAVPKRAEVSCFPIESGPETVADGVAEVWFDDMATLRRATASVVKEAQHSVAHTSDRIRLSSWRSIASVNVYEVFAVLMDERAAASLIHSR